MPRGQSVSTCHSGTNVQHPGPQIWDGSDIVDAADELPSSLAELGELVVGLVPEDEAAEARASGTVCVCRQDLNPDSHEYEQALCGMGHGLYGSHPNAGYLYCRDVACGTVHGCAWAPAPTGIDCSGTDPNLPCHVMRLIDEVRDAASLDDIDR